MSPAKRSRRTLHFSRVDSLSRPSHFLTFSQNPLLFHTPPTLLPPQGLQESFQVNGLTFERNAGQRGRMERASEEGGRKETKEVKKSQRLLFSSSFSVTHPQQFSRVSPAAGAASEVRDAVIQLDRNNRAVDGVHSLGRVSSTQTEEQINGRCAATVLHTSALFPRSTHSFSLSFSIFLFFSDSVPTDGAVKRKEHVRSHRAAPTHRRSFARFLLPFTVVFV